MFRIIDNKQKSHDNRFSYVINVVANGHHVIHSNAHRAKTFVTREEAEKFVSEKGLDATVEEFERTEPKLNLFFEKFKKQ